MSTCLYGFGLFATVPTDNFLVMPRAFPWLYTRDFSLRELALVKFLGLKLREADFNMAGLCGSRYIGMG